MNQHDKHGHDHAHHHGSKGTPIHKNWITWVVVGLMLAAMAMYVLSDDEALQPGGAQPTEQVPAAE
jgi:hypothetical protein